MAPGMDEIIFRATEGLELMHMHLAAGATQAKDYIVHIHQVVLQAWNNPTLTEAIESAIESARAAAARASDGAQEAWRRTGITDLPSPMEIFDQINALMKDRMWRRTALILVCGVACGSVLGVAVGWQWGARPIAVPHCRALHSTLDGSAVIVEDGAGAMVRHTSEVVIRVHAFTVDPLDKEVLRGRARNLRDLLKPRNKEVTIGRSFSGVVIEMGPNVTRLDIGDEVWGAFSEWEGGGAQELVGVSSRRVGRSPRALPPEAAASLPHQGALALHHLQQAKINSHTAKGKRVLIVGAGSGSGCVMLQLLKAWGASTTAVCDPRARPLVTALGAQEVITVDWCDDATGADANSALANQLISELAAHPESGWDAVLLCRAPPQLRASRLPLARPSCPLQDLRPSPLCTDRTAKLFLRVYGVYLTMRRLLAWARGVDADADFLLPAPLDAQMLDLLAAHVEAGNLQTVVDKVYPLQDFEMALSHACGAGAIGCTVIRMS